MFIVWIITNLKNKRKAERERNVSTNKILAKVDESFERFSRNFKIKSFLLFFVLWLLLHFAVDAGSLCYTQKKRERNERAERKRKSVFQDEGKHFEKESALFINSVTITYKEAKFFVHRRSPLFPAMNKQLKSYE